MLTKEQVQHIESFKVPVSQGRGLGICPFATMMFERPLVSIDVESVMPTDDETRLVRTYIEFGVRRYFNETWVNKILSAKLPVVEGHNTLVLLKGPAWRPNGESGWAYRRITWEVGPSFMPFDDGPWSLLQALDREETDTYPRKRVNEKWLATSGRNLQQNVS